MRILILLTIFFSSLIVSAQDAPPQPEKEEYKEKFVKINPKGTYFPFVDKGLDLYAEAPTRFNLSELKPTVQKGTILGIRRVGAFADGLHPDIIKSGVAVFIDAYGQSIAPGPKMTTYFVGPEPFCAPPPLYNYPKVDVPNDFNFGQANIQETQNTPGIEYEVEVPDGAVALLLAPGDCAVSDNFDDNNDYGALIRVKPRECKVSDKRAIEFFPQVFPGYWSQNLLGFHAGTDPDPKYIREVGCVLTSYAMIFKSLGIGSLYNKIDDDLMVLPYTSSTMLYNTPTDPATLNMLFRGTSSLNSSVQAFTSQNNLTAPRAAEAARASYQLQCYNQEYTKGLAIFNKQSVINSCIQKSASAFSVQASPRWKRSISAEALTNHKKKIEEAICEGKPVALRVEKEEENRFGKYDGHTVVATESYYTPEGDLTFKIHNPATRFGGNVDFSTLSDSYPFLVGYDKFVTDKDPSMITIYGTANMDFVLTDNLGRRIGFDPFSKVEYNEIPGAYYSYEGIDPILEEGELLDKEPMGSNRLFLSENVLSGDYNIKVYPIENGVGQLSIFKTDVQGFSNDTEEHSLVLVKNQIQEISFKHIIEAVPINTTSMRINYSRYENNQAKIYGELVLPEAFKLSCSDTITFNFGALTDIRETLQLSLFSKKLLNGIIYYQYTNSKYKIVISEDGKLWFDIFDLDFTSINIANKGRITVNFANNIATKNLKLNCSNNVCYGE